MSMLRMDGDVMDAAITGHTSTQALSQNDKDSYDAAYNNY